MSRAGTIWNKMTEEEKKPYNELHEKDVKRYEFIDLLKTICRHEKQLRELKEKGYFLLADGTKSTDVPVPGKKRRTQKSPKKDAKDRKKTHKDKEMAKSEKKSVKKDAKKPVKKGKDVSEDEGDLDLNEDDSQGESD